MAQKTRGALQVLLHHMFASGKKKIKPKLMGEDHFGTKYFEEPPESSGRKTRGRFFEPVNEDDFQQELPAEWESWLRYRRAQPPTKEEIEANYRMILMKRENAAKLDAQYAAQKDPETRKQLEEKSIGSFPVYEDYKPGKKNDN